MLARSGRLRAAFTQRDALRLVAVTLLLVVSLGAVLATDALLPGPLLGSGVIVDDIARVHIRAPHSATYVSQVETERRRDAARAAVEPQYNYTPDRGRL
ncbi:MAG TPA: hypothetical protein VNT28_05240, partial [Candidatus Limnocylindrales bacterium]|nr:hypothetical protein [Candidatus Limnocylindrales bacterium]